MEAMKHTPGPWSVEKGDPECGNYGWYVCHPDTVDEESAICNLSVEAEANARLIAAAPELLEALKECITDDGATGMRSIELARKRLAAINKLARAAIAKATQ